MSAAPGVRRTDKQLSDEETQTLLAQAYCGRVASIGPDGYPYCLPILHVVMDGQIYLHNTAAGGHLKSNVLADDRVCFEVDEPGEIFDYGRFECDSSVAYRSAIASGRIRIVKDGDEQRRFFDAFLDKYADRSKGRPKGFLPRLKQITVYAIKIERLTGKHNPLPAPDQQWPAKDYSKTPNAKPPVE